MSIRVERKQGPNAPETVYDDPIVNLLLSNEMDNAQDRT
jgi:hypothetical protein